MSGVLIDIDLNAESAKKDLAAINKGLANLINSSDKTGKSLGQITANGFKDLNKTIMSNNIAMRQFGQTSKTSLDQTAKAATNVSSAVNTIKSSVLALGGALAALGSVNYFNRTADSLTNIQNRLRLVIDDTDQLLIKQRQLFQVARDTRSEFAQSVGVYADFATSLEEAGIAGSRLLKVTKTIQQGIALSGTSVEGAKDALMQLGQGLASGTIRGEELNSVLEQLKYVGIGLKRELGMNAGELRKFAEEGKLTTEVLLDVLERLSDRTSKDFERTSATASQAVMQLRQSMSLFFGEINQKIGATDSFAKRVLKMADSFASGADRIFAKSYELDRSFKNFYHDLNAYSASEMVIKGIVALEIDPLDAFEKYTYYKRIQDRFKSLEEFFKVRPVEVDANVQFVGSSEDISRMADMEGALKSVNKPLSDFQLVLQELKRTGDAALDGLVIGFSNFGKLLPRFLAPVAEVETGFRYAFKTMLADVNAWTYDAIMPAARSLEKLSQYMSLFSKGDNKLERAWVTLFKSDNLVEFNNNLEQLNVVRKQLRWDDKSFLGRELFRSIRRANEEVENFLIEIGLLENKLIRVRDLNLDRLAMYFSNLGRVVERVYQDVFATTFEPIVARFFYGVEAAGYIVIDVFNDIFSRSMGVALGEALASGFKAAFLGIFDFWEWMESDTFSFDKLFKKSFSQRAFDTVKKMFRNLADFITGFFIGFGKTLVDGLSTDVFFKAFSSIAATIQVALQSTKDYIRSFISSIQGYFVKIDLGSMLTIDSASFEGAVNYIVGMFQQVVNKSAELAGKAAVIVKDFCQNINDYFFNVYDEVVGHSYWPDTIDEVVAYTDGIFKADSTIERFAKSVKEKFSGIFDSLVSMGLGAGGAVADFTIRVTQVDLSDFLRRIQDSIVGAVGAALILAFSGNIALKVAAGSYFFNIVNDALGGAFYAFSDQAASLVGFVAQALARSLADGFLNGLHALIVAIPEFATSFFTNFTQNLLDLSDGFMSVISFLPIITNQLLGSLAIVAAAYAYFVKDGTKTIAEIIFGKKATKKNPATEGVTDYLKALFPQLNKAAAGASDGIISNLFPHKKMALAAVAAISASLFTSISALDSLEIGLPLLAFAILGKDNGARLARDVSAFGYRLIGDVYSSMAARIGSSLGTDSIVYKIFDAPIEAFRPSDARKSRSNIGKAVDNLQAAASAAVANMRKNSNLYGQGLISFSDMFTLDFSDMQAGVGVAKPVKEIERAMQKFRTSISKVSLGPMGTLGDAFSSLSDMAILGAGKFKRGMTSFKNSLVKTFTLGWQGILGAIALLKDGFKGLFGMLANRYVLFAALMAGFVGTAFAASDASTAISTLTTNAGDAALALGKIVVALAAVGVAYRAFQAFNVGKAMAAQLQAGTYVRDTFDAGFEKSRQKRAVQAERAIADAVEAAKSKLADKAKVAERKRIFKSELDRLEYRKQAKLRNEKIISRYQSSLASMSTVGEAAQLAMYSKQYEKETKRLETLKNKSGMSAGFANSMFFFEDMFTSIREKAARFTDFLYARLFDDTPWLNFGKTAQHVMENVFKVDPAIITAVLDNIGRIKKGLAAIRDGNIAMAVSETVAGVAGATGGILAGIGSAIGTILAGVKNLGGTLKSIGGFLLKIGKGLFSVISSVLTLFKGVFKWTAVIAAGAGALGALGAWLFGPSNSFIDNLEWVYDKVKAIFGLASSTAGGRKGDLIKNLGGEIQVGDQQVNFSSLIKGIDFEKMSDVQAKILQDTSSETRKSLENLNELYVKQGGFTADNVNELDKIRKEMKNILLRMPQGEDTDFAGSVNAFNKGITEVETTFFDMLRNFVGWKPVLETTKKEIGAFQKSVMYLGDHLTSWPAIIGGVIGMLGGPLGAAVGTAVGAAISALADGIGSVVSDVADSIASTEVAQAIGSAFDLIGDWFVIGVVGFVEDMGNRIGKAADEFYQKLKNKPTEIEIEIQTQINKSLGNLPQFSKALEGEDQAALQEAFDKATAAGLRYAQMMRKGAQSNDPEVVAKFAKNLAEAEKQAEKARDELSKLAATQDPYAQKLYFTNQLLERQNKLFNDASKVLGINFGEDNKEFIGDSFDEAAIKKYTSLVVELEKQLKTTYDLSEQRSIKLNIESIKQEAKGLETYIKSSGLLDKDIELKVKLTADIMSGDDLKRLYQQSPQAYQMLEGHSKAYNKYLNQLNAATVETPVEEIQLIIKSMQQLRKEALTLLPGVTMFDQINAKIQSLGGKEMSVKTFSFISDADVKKLSDLGGQVDSLKIDLKTLRQGGGTKSEEVEILNKLQQATAAYISTVNQFEVARAESLITDKSLGSLTKAYAVSQQLGVEVPANLRNNKSAMEQWAKIQVEMAAKQLLLNRLIETGAEGSEEQIAALGTSLIALQMQLDSVTNVSVFSFDSLIGKLQETGLAISDISFSRLSSGAQQSLASIGSRLEALSKKMSESSAQGLAGDGLKRIIAERQTLLVKAREQMIDALYLTGDGITQGLNNVGVGDLKAIAMLTADKIKSLLGLDKKLQLARAALNDTSNPEDYAKALKEVVALETKANRLSAESTRTFTDRVSAINEVLKTNIDDSTFATMGAEAFASLSNNAMKLKGDLAEALQYGVTSAGESLVNVFSRMKEAARQGAYLSFFATMQKDVEDSFTNGAKTSFENLSGLLGDLELDFDSFLNIPNDMRREYDRQASIIKAAEQAFNLPGMTQELADILNDVTVPLEKRLEEFQAASGVQLVDLKSPVEDNTAAIRENTRVLSGKTALPAATGVKDVAAGFNGSATPNKAAFNDLESRKGKLGINLLRDSGVDARSILKNVRFDTEALNLAKPGELKAASEIAKKLIEAQAALKEAAASGGDTTKLQSDVIAYKEALEAMAGVISDSARKVSNAGKSFASQVTSDFNSAFRDMMKGKSDDDKGVFETFFDNIMESFTSSVVDTFAAGLLDPLTGDNGIITKMMKGLGESIWSVGNSIFSDGKGGSIGGVAGDVAGGLLGGKKGDAASEGIIGALKSTTDRAIDATVGFFSNLGGLFSEGLSSLGAIFSKALSGLGSMFSSLFGGGGWGALAGGVASVFAADGGHIRGPGTSRSDSIPAMLSNGEFVVNAEATRKNVNLLHAINSGKIAKFADGGLISTAVVQKPVAASVTPVVPQGGGSSEQVFNINITGDISRQTKQEIYKMLPQIATGVNAHNREKNIR